MRKRILAAALLIFFAVVGCVIYFSFRGTYVAEINGKRIGVDEYNIYLYEMKIDYETSLGEDIWEFSFEGSSLEDIAKQYALDSIVYVKVAVNQAARLGVSLSKEDESLAEQRADSYIANLRYDFGVNRNVLISVSRDLMIATKVRDVVTGSYELSEADFLSYYEDYLRSSRAEYVNIELQCVFIEGQSESSQKRIGEARSQLYGKVPFETVVIEYSDNYKESEGVVTYTEIPSGWDSAVSNAAYSLAEGEVSEIISVKEGYYILYAKMVSLPDMEELKANLRDSYILSKKEDIYRQESEKWSKDAIVKRNDKVWNEIRIIS